MKWSIGDTVRLKTGGCEMTVNRLHAVTESVECVWFEVTEYGWKGPMSGTFHEDTLVDASTQETVQ